MQVVLGSRGDYAVRAVLFLARQPGRHTRSEVAREMDIPHNYLPQVLAALVDAGLVRSTVGRGGGYELGRAAETVTLREVVEVAEGPLRSQKCVLRAGPCYWAEKCAVHDAWVAAEDALVQSLAGTTFAELARTDWELEQKSPSLARTGRPVERLHPSTTTSTSHRAPRPGSRA